VKKYLKISYVSFSILSLFLFQFIGTVNAQAREGQRCNNAPINVNPTLECATGFRCNTDHPDAVFPGFLPHEGICEAVPTVDCTCAGGGQNAGVAQNGINCPGKPTIFCADRNHACYAAPPGTAIDRGSLNFNGNDGAYNNVEVRNVDCRPVQPNAVCRCLGNGTVNENNFECVREGQSFDDPNAERGSGTCGPQFQCQTVGNQETLPDDQVENKRGILESGSVVKGIACRQPEATCTCDTNVAPNGFRCTQFGREETDTCDDPNMKCVNDPASVLPGGEGTEDNIFNGAPLKGIICQLPGTATERQYPTVPPPPPPPCLRLGDGGCVAFSTAVGELGTKPEEFITRLFAILLSVSGGIALLLIIKAGYQMLTSQGKPEQINAGRDQLVAAIVGLIFLIFSFVILQVIGFDILQIPGFSGAGAGGGQNGSGVAGAPCDVAGNNQCGNTGLECVATGTGRSGTCQ
jgi:hypothetical protein